MMEDAYGRSEQPVCRFHPHVGGGKFGFLRLEKPKRMRLLGYQITKDSFINRSEEEVN